MAVTDSQTVDMDRLAELLETVGHATRLRVLFTIDGAYPMALSPSELAGIFAATCSLGSMSYHVRRLANAGQLRLKTTAKRRGAVEHYYVLTPKGRKLVDQLRELVA
jgi:DNA-binding MarR family transcriptional regulator